VVAQTVTGYETRSEQEKEACILALLALPARDLNKSSGIFKRKQKEQQNSLSLSFLSREAG
jgi:hypothetical protein